MPSSTHPSHQMRALARIGTLVQQKYRIKRLLGTGGMAVVYAATHRNGHRVAIKYLLDHLVHEPDVARLFSREAYVANEVGHAGAVPVLDDDVDEEGCPFLIMPLLEGETLRVRCARAKGRLPLAEVCVLVLDVLDVLASAHAKGIVHRDIKPDNLFVTDAGNVRVLDFGIARKLEHGASATSTVPIFGTPAFMPPEQARGEREAIGPHSDCWAVGATFFTALSGQHVHPAGGAMGLQIIASATRKARSLAEVAPDVPPSFVQFVDKALEFDPEKRWRSAREMHDALLAIFEEVVGESVTQGAARVRAEIVAGLTQNREDIATEATQPAERHRSWDTGDASKAMIASGTPKDTVRKRGRTRDALLAGVGVVVLAGAVLAARYHRAPKPTSQADAAEPVGTPVLALPISPTCSKEAQIHFRQGLIAIRQATWELAHAAFEKAAAADPMCPEVQLQRMMTGTPVLSVSQWREEFHHALSLRDAMSERDRALLDAYAPVVASEPADYEEAARRFEVAASRFPRDVEILFLAGLARLVITPDPRAVEYCLALTRQAIDIDPQDANAWEVKAKALMSLERYDEAMVALDTCLEIARGSTDCLYDRIHIHRLLGQCSAAATDARRWVANAPASKRAYFELASSLAADGSFAGTVDVALRQARNNDPSEDRESTYLYYQASLSVLNGDFEEAGKRIQRTLEQLKEASAIVGHARALALSVELLNEIGRGDRAAKSAEQFFHQRGAWTEGWAVPLDYEPILLGVLLHEGATSREQWDASSTQWEHAALSVLTRRQAWAFRWGPAGATRNLAIDAWTQRPTDASTAGSAGVIEQTTLIPALAKAFEGRIAVVAGEYAQASAALESATKSCDNLEQPFVSTRAFLWLGEAKEGTADKQAACDAYGVVLQRWGNAKPRSVSAEEAKRRSRALGCKTP
ncbi:protein kinase [Pendulispora rubella]|uniref:Protein kinase n=1 Tax=Pendulispora rubella TaxID=2741070 RepID=A0ABZ2L305_9BACT